MSLSLRAKKQNKQKQNKTVSEMKGLQFVKISLMKSKHIASTKFIKFACRWCNIYVYVLVKDRFTPWIKCLIEYFSNDNNDNNGDDNRIRIDPLYMYMWRFNRG